MKTKTQILISVTTLVALSACAHRSNFGPDEPTQEPQPQLTNPDSIPQQTQCASLIFPDLDGKTALSSKEIANGDDTQYTLTSIQMSAKRNEGLIAGDAEITSINEFGEIALGENGSQCASKLQNAGDFSVEVEVPAWIDRKNGTIPQMLSFGLIHSRLGASERFESRSTQLDLDTYLADANQASIESTSVSSRANFYFLDNGILELRGVKVVEGNPQSFIARYQKLSPAE